MRHHNKNKKFGREKGVRKALVSSLLRALVEKGAIETTEAKAKALRPVVEKVVSRSKKDTLHNRRMIRARFGHSIPVERLFGEIGPRYKEREGGYTRITKLPIKKDAIARARIEFV